MTAQKNSLSFIQWLLIIFLLLPVAIFLMSIQSLANISSWLNKHIQNFNNKVNSE